MTRAAGLARRVLRRPALAALVLAMLLASCASAYRAVPAEPSSRRVSPADSPLARWAADAVAPGAAADSAAHLLADGGEALAARLALIDRASTGIDLQVYIFRPDRSGRAVAAALWRAAERGVRVRLLLDDWGAKPADEALAALAAHPRVDIRLFNPLSTPGLPLLDLLVDFDGTHRRMHNKLLVVDGRAAVVGGRNIGDEYFTRRSAVSFGDLDTLLAGPVVDDLARSFDDYWNARTTVAVRGRARDAEPVAGPPEPVDDLQAAADAFAQRMATSTLPLFRGPAVALSDAPDKLERDDTGTVADPHVASDVAARLAEVVGEVQRELLIVSPYFVPGDGGVARLVALRRRGVAVHVVTNSLAATDVPAVHAGYARHRRALLAAGVVIHEIRPDAGSLRARRGAGSGPRIGGSSRLSLHAKVLVMDRRWSYVGSMNLDPRSIRHNTENGVAMAQPGLAAAIADGIAQALPGDAWRVEWRDGGLRWIQSDGDREVVLAREPGASAWLRLQVRVLSWLPVEHLL